MIFNTAVPNCSHIKVYIEVENTGSGTIYGLNWDFMVYRKNYGWYDITTFAMPSDGKYTVDCDIPSYNITEELYGSATASSAMPINVKHRI